MSDTVNSVISLSQGDDVVLLPAERRKMLTDISLRFSKKKADYRRGNWLLSQEICAVPSRLWACLLLDMASNKQIASWKVTASTRGTGISKIFPVCNDQSEVTHDDLNNFARGSLDNTQNNECLPRSDFLLCIRTLKILEQMCFSRSRTCVGPLTVTLSIAGILEHSPSWASVLHALGIVTSHDSTEDFKKRLIAEREQSEHGAFDQVELDERVVTLQIDNFDILPLHSVKGSGKAIPMISGTATQGIVQSKKRGQLSLRSCYKDTPTCSSDSHALWRDPRSILTSRSDFISSLNTEEDQCILNDFFDVVFGVVHNNRNQLLGSPSSKAIYRRGKTEMAYKHQGLNFRTLLLSSFKPHGGLDVSTPSLFDQDVLFVDVSRMSAADILNIHQKLGLIKQLLKPGHPGSPRYVVVSGDQPTYKMFVKIWRNSFLEAKRGNQGQAPFEELRIHEWLTPFPGFFHIEKQSLFPLCKEMLHGLGLEEFAACCGLSRSQVANILKHSHSRNNRAVLFNICVALIIHTSDLVLTEEPDLKDELERISREPQAWEQSKRRRSDSKLLSCTAESVTDATIEIGKRIRERVQDFFSHCPNGKHIVNTVLFTSLLPTVGFHVLSRTGHTDVVDSFWLRLNNILHTSGHLKYQELYLFYAFFKSILPKMVLSDLFTDKPGAMVARVPSFTGGIGGLYDLRGWVYVHLDEALEMLIIRLIKSLNVLMLPYIESCGAWLLVVSHARMLIRAVTASTHSYNRKRHDETTEIDCNPVLGYDRNAAQCATVNAIVQLMRRKGFLSLEHRNSEKLRNVLGDTTEELDDGRVQRLILDADNYGKQSAELHASAMLPDIFGPLSDADIKEYFGGKRFRGEWTKARQVPTAGNIMAAHREKNSVQAVEKAGNPKKAFSDRRLVVSKLMTSLTLVEHAAIRGGDLEGAEHARRRWQVLHSARYLMSPFADAYRSSDSSVRHANKSLILSSLSEEFIDEANAHPHHSEQRNRIGSKSISFYYDYSMPQYTSVMVDLMNHIWSRGTDGRRGNSLYCVTVLN